MEREPVPADQQAEIDARDAAPLSDHEATFHPPPVPPGPPPTPDPRPGRHRARSQVASTEDVEQIAALTKRYKEAAAAAGIEPLPGESPRVFELRTRVELAERVRDAKAAQAAPPAPAPAPIHVPDPPPAFTEPEPQLEQFAASPDPYAAWQRALARYDRRKDEHAHLLQEHAQIADQAGRHVEEVFQQITATHTQRLADFKSRTSDFVEVLQTAKDLPTSPAMQAAIMLHPDGPAFIYTLAKNPELHDDLFLLTDGKPVSDALVATVQRRLTQRLQAGTTGSAAARTQVPPAPRPPNPVRTVPHALSTDGRPSDEDSLSAHERFHYPQGPRGRFRG